MKTVLVTGAGSGLGRAVALTLAAQGHSVLAGCQIRPQITDLLRDAETLDDRIKPFRLDLTREDDLAMATALAMTEQVDVLFNNAGTIEAGPLAEVDLDLVREVFEVNVFRTLDLTQRVLTTAMLPTRAGRIVFMSSVGGLLPVPLVGAYTASKHALEAIAATLRLEQADAGIEVAVINPELLDTGFDARAFDAHFETGLYRGPDHDAAVAHLSKAHDPVDVIDDICAVVVGDRPAYRTVVPTDARAEVHGRQAATWAWSSGPYARS